MVSLLKNASGVISLKNLLGGAAVSLFALGVVACSKSDETAGGVTDIGNSVASGFVVTEGNLPVAHARVVAYYDSWDKTSIEDSVVVVADDNGKFELKFDSTRSVVLYAETGSESGLSRIQDSGSSLVVVGHPRRLESSVAEASSGYMRIVGSNAVASVGADGSFAFDSMPVGKILLAYVAEVPQARFDFMTTIVGDTVKIPPLEKLSQNNGWLTVSDYRYYNNAAYAGIMVNVPEGITVPQVEILPQDTTEKDTSVKDTTAKDSSDIVKDTTARDTSETVVISYALHLDGSDSLAKVYNSDGTEADPDNIDYVDGISGEGVSLKVGQHIGLGYVDPSAGDFTVSLWTVWKGFREGSFYQILFAQRSNWAESFARIQLQYDFAVGAFAAVSEAISPTGLVWLSEPGRVRPLNEWANITLVYEDGKLFFYVNGELVSDENGVPFTLKDFLDPVPFRIGGTEIANDTWNGVIDEVTIESTARSAEWVKAQYEALAK